MGLRSFYLKKVWKEVEKNYNLNGKKILDLGCGDGAYLKNISKKISEGFGVDISKKSIKKAEKDKAKNLLFCVGDIENLKLKRKFDVVVCIDVLEHVKNYEKAIKNVLKRGEKNIFITANPKFAVLLRLLEKLKLKNPEKRFYRWIGRKEVEKVVKKLGKEIEKSYNFFLFQQIVIVK